MNTTVPVEEQEAQAAANEDVIYVALEPTDDLDALVPSVACRLEFYHEDERYYLIVKPLGAFGHSDPATKVWILKGARITKEISSSFKGTTYSELIAGLQRWVNSQYVNYEIISTAILSLISLSAPYQRPSYLVQP